MINNLPDYAKDYEFIVARFADGEYWFWGAYSDERKACEVAKNIDGIVFEKF